MMYSRTEDITPEVARSYLEKSAGNRPLSARTVNNYARDMASGKWELTAQGIAFNENGALTDGRHRLRAVVKANVTVQMNVTYDEPAKTTIHDRGRIRTQSNVLNMRGFSNDIASTSVIGAVNYLFTVSGNAHVSDQVIADFCAENGDMLKKITSINAGGANKPICKKAPIYAATFCALYCGVPEDTLRDFYAIANSGFGFSQTKSAAIVLRNFLLSGTINYGKSYKERVFTVTTNAIKDFANAQPRKQNYKNDAKPAYFQHVRENLIDKYLDTYRQLTIE